MEIIKDTYLRTKYSPGLSETKSGEKRVKSGIFELTIHASGGPGSIRKWMTDSDLKKIRELVKNAKTKAEAGKWQKEYDKVALWYAAVGVPQYELPRKGPIIELFDPMLGRFHSNADDYDILHTIGVEIVKEHEDNSDNITDDQFEALVFLYGHLLGEGFPLKQTSTHDRNRKIYPKPPIAPKPCPGPMPWIALEANLKLIQSDVEVLR